MMNIKYVYSERINPMTEVIVDVLTIPLSSQYYIDQEEKKLKIAKKSFNDPMIDKQVQAFYEFKRKHL